MIKEFGGVVGALGSVGTNIIQYCYNKGKVEGTCERIGGITGQHRTDSEVKYSYNIGEVRGTTNVGGCIGESNKDCGNNLYYLTDKVYVNGTKSNVAYNSTAVAECLKTDAQFKNEVTQTTASVAYLLNGNSATGAWAVDTSINGGYPYLTAFDNTNIWVRDTNKKPILKWQVENN